MPQTYHNFWMHLTLLIFMVSIGTFLKHRNCAFSNIVVVAWDQKTTTSLSGTRRTSFVGPAHSYRHHVASKHNKQERTAFNQSILCALHTLTSRQHLTIRFMLRHAIFSFVKFYRFYISIGMLCIYCNTLLGHLLYCCRLWISGLSRKTSAVAGCSNNNFCICWIFFCNISGWWI